MSECGRNYRMLCLNIRSLPSHHCDLEVLVTIMRFPEIVVLTKTLSQHNSDSYDLSGYHHFHKYRRDCRVGVVSIFVKDTIKVRNCEVGYCAYVGEHAESIFIELVGTVTSCNPRPTVIGSIYRPPPLSAQPFVDSIESLLDKCRQSNQKYHSFEDFIIQLQRYPTGSVVDGLINAFLASSFFFPLECNLTRVSMTSQSIITDNLFTSDTAILRNSSTHVNEDTSSDHYPILLSVDHGPNWDLNSVNIGSISNYRNQSSDPGP